MMETNFSVEGPFFLDKKNCCGCGACVSKCPKNAIEMKYDLEGFSYPLIDCKLCINCGVCKKVCGFQIKKKLNETLSVYVASNKDEDMIMHSTSGGVFSALAESVLKDGGVVFGCAYGVEKNMLSPRHIKIKSIDEIRLLQGSKYVQSDIGAVYEDVLQEIMSGKIVLFSGTPCQVEAMRSFLGKEYENLILVDIVCHGVPGRQFFIDFIKNYEKKLKGQILNLEFRNKVYGWGLRACVTYRKNGTEKKKYIEPWQLSYYQLFLSSETYRKNCYICKYAGKGRPGDLTIGDYWGIEKAHPEVIGNKFDPKKGISCIWVNTKLGDRCLKKYGQGINLYVSTFEKAAQCNGQLKHPSNEGKNRNEILEIYRKDGYAGVEEWFDKRISKTRMLKFYIKSFLVKIGLMEFR